MKPIEMEIMRITPAMAEELLKKNYENNRPIKHNNITTMVEDMQRGKWALSHQGIALDPDGYVFDGQHRLNAIVKSGCSVKMCVFRYNDWDVAKNVFSVLDIGSRRSTRDAAILTGESQEFMKNFKMISAAKRLIWFKEDDKYNGNLVISNDTVLDYMRQNEAFLKDIYKITRSCSRFMNAPIITALALAYRAGESYEDLYNFVGTYTNNEISFPDKPYNCKLALDAKNYSMKANDTTAQRKHNILVLENYIYSYIRGHAKLNSYKERYPYNTILNDT